ncbi:hypothetical protein [Collimonas antrihumi]|uniref:hypothetical protein n=1 Tax=Collimonas antrihumi TaxID=1940615 RepID=UPI001B8CF7BC|nr:hypothetical protein [Collimonas antrihumi]
MKQPNDSKTVDIFEGEKRGRGRPRVENAKSPAERARLYRLNKKSRPQVVAAPSVDAVNAAYWKKRVAELEGQVISLERDSYNSDVRARFAEDLCDEQLVEIARLRAELDKGDASQKGTSLKSYGKLEAELIVANARILTLDAELQDAQDFIFKRDASQKNISKVAVKMALKKPSRKAVTKKDSLEEQFDYPD